MMLSLEKDNTFNEMHKLKQNLHFISSQFDSYDGQSAFESPSKRTRVENDVYQDAEMRPRLVAEPEVPMLMYEYMPDLMQQRHEQQYRDEFNVPLDSPLLQNCYSSLASMTESNQPCSSSFLNLLATNRNVRSHITMTNSRFELELENNPHFDSGLEVHSFLGSHHSENIEHRGQSSLPSSLDATPQVESYSGYTPLPFELERNQKDSTVAVSRCYDVEHADNLDHPEFGLPGFQEGAHSYAIDPFQTENHFNGSVELMGIANFIARGPLTDMEHHFESTLENRGSVQISPLGEIDPRSRNSFLAHGSYSPIKLRNMHHNSIIVTPNAEVTHPEAAAFTKLSNARSYVSCCGGLLTNRTNFVENNSHRSAGPPIPTLDFKSMPEETLFQESETNLWIPPFTLYLPSDDDALSQFQCLVRKQIELFQAGAEDAESTTRGRNRRITKGQVGIRCRHCSFLPPKKRTRGATYYPAKFDIVYQSSQNMAIMHLCENCPHIPEDIKSELQKLRDCKSTAGGGKVYWADGVSALGVVETKYGGLRFG